MGAAHEDLDGGVVEDGLGVDGAGLEHAGQSKSGSVQESKSLWRRCCGGKGGADISTARDDSTPSALGK
jgi:hypothetical protein